MLQVCSSFPVASGEVLQGSGCGGILPCATAPKGPARGEGGAEPPAQRLRRWGGRVAHQRLQNPNYISLMSTHTVIRGSSGAKQQSELF